MKDMRPEEVVGEFREHTLTYHDGTSRKVLVTEIETCFPEGCLIVSRTDTAGIITHVNKSFVEMSGFTETELIGQPHHILRHPDMPPAAFADLWQTLQRGEKWHGYVKNLRKDGGFYWVYATAIPNIRKGQVIGYSSIRRQPSRRKVEECMQLYPTMF